MPVAHPAETLSASTNLMLLTCRAPRDYGTEEEATCKRPRACCFPKAEAQAERSSPSHCSASTLAL